MCLPALTNTRFKNESMIVQIFFWNMLYEMSHEFDITHELLVLDWHYKDILCLVVFYFICQTRFIYNVYFTHNVARTGLVFYNG